MGGLTITHTWVEVSNRSLAVRVDAPAHGEARGVVVLVPPVGRERVSFHRSVIAAAVACAEADLMVWTPSLTGEGDSTSASGFEDLATTWVADVTAVADVASRAAPNLPLTLVGVRLGAAITSRVEHPAVKSRMDWDPVSGRHYVRAQLALRVLTLSNGDFTPPEDTEFIGSALSSRQLDSLRTLCLLPGEQATMIPSDPDPERNADSHPQLGRVARAGVEAVVAGAAVSEMHAMSWAPLLSTVTSHPGSGRGVRETFVHVGPHRLVGVLSEPEDGPADPVAVVFTATGSELREGPAAVWADLARRLAEGGVAALRADRGLIGDAVDARLDSATNPYSEQGVADLCAAVDLMTRRGHEVVAVGLCVGAWLALRAAAQSSIVETVAINTLVWADSDGRAAAGFDRSLAWSRSGVALRTAVAGRAGGRRPADLVRRAVARARGAVARRPWVRPALLAIRYGGLGVGVLVEAARHGSVTLVHGREEGQVFRALGGNHAVRMFGVESAVHVVDRPGLEHSLFTRWSREAVADVVVRRVDARRRR